MVRAAGGPFLKLQVFSYLAFQIIVFLKVCFISVVALVILIDFWYVFVTGLLRCGKSCRLRWINYLRPDLKRGNFTEEEDELIINLHGLLGNKYCFLP